MKSETTVHDSAPRAAQGRQAAFLCALDLDGTILDRDGVISDAVVAAMTDASQAGCLIVIATGRSISEFSALTERNPVLRDVWAICSDGATINEPGIRRPSRWTSVDGTPLTTLKSKIPDLALVVERMDGSFVCSEPMDPAEFPEPAVVLGWETTAREPGSRLFVRTLLLGVDALRLEFEAISAYRSVVYSMNGYTYADLTASSCSKAASLDRLAEWFEVAGNRRAAIGDSWNDISMLRWASWAAAMADAPTEVQAEANCVVNDISDDGAATFLRSVIDKWGG